MSLRTRRAIPSVPRAGLIGVGAVVALGLLVVLVFAVDVLAKAIANDPSQGWVRLVTILVLLLVGVALVGGALSIAVAGLSELEPLPGTKTLGTLLEWLGSAVLGLVILLVFLAGVGIAIILALSAGVAAFWAFMYGGAHAAMYLFGVTFGWGLLIMVGVFFACSCVGGALWPFYEARRSAKRDRASGGAEAPPVT